MPVASTSISTSIALATRLLSPIILDIYKEAKGKVKEELTNWSMPTQVKKIAKTLSKIENVKTLWSSEKEIHLKDFYYPSKIKNNNKNTIIDISSLKDLPEGNLTIQGIVGQGKSIFLRYLASQALHDENNTLIPIFLELRTLSIKNGLMNAIFRVLESVNVKISEASFEYLVKTKKLVLLLDGFDEITDEIIKEVINDIQYITTKYPELQVIVSSRPGNEIQKISGFQIIEIAPLEEKDYSPFLERLGISVIKRNEIVDAIKKSPANINGIIRTPLMMTLVVMVYESEREIPPTLPEFFERLFQVVFTRHDRLKAGFNRKHHCGLSETKLQLLFESFCFMVVQLGYGRSLTQEQFINAFDYAISYTQNCTCEVEKFRLDITKVACLMLEEGIDLATFIHKSIMEYYAASFIKHSADEFAAIFYENVRGNYKQWSEVLVFLKEIDPYRYSREYIMYEAPPILNEVSILLENKNEFDLLSFINKHQPDMKMHFSKGNSKSINGFGPINPSISAIMEDFDNIIIHSVIKSINQISISEVNKIISEVPNTDSYIDDHQSSITINLVIRHFGAEEFWNSLKNFENNIQLKIKKAQEIIEIQSKRKLIFIKK